MFIIGFIPALTGQKGHGGIHNDIASCHCCTAEQHTEPHIIAVCQCDFYRPDLMTQPDVSLNNIALFGMSTRVGDCTLIDKLGFTPAYRFRFSLVGMQPESHPGLDRKSTRLNS